MSARHLNAAYSVRGLSVGEGAVLHFFSWKANDSGLAFPSLQTVSEATGLSERQTQRAIMRLRQLGYLVPNGSTAGGRGKTTVYSVVLPSEERVTSQPEKGDTQSDKPRHGGGERVTAAAEKGVMDGRAIRNEIQEIKTEITTDTAFKALLLREKLINPHPYETWVKPLRLLGVEDGALVFAAPVREFLNVGEKFGVQFLQAAKALNLDAHRIRIVVQ